MEAFKFFWYTFSKPFSNSIALFVQEHFNKIFENYVNFRHPLTIELAEPSSQATLLCYN